MLKWQNRCHIQPFLKSRARLSMRVLLKMGFLEWFIAFYKITFWSIYPPKSGPLHHGTLALLSLITLSLSTPKDHHVIVSGATFLDMSTICVFHSSGKVLFLLYLEWLEEPGPSPCNSIFYMQNWSSPQLFETLCTACHGSAQIDSHLWGLRCSCFKGLWGMTCRMLTYTDWHK